jgi:hypothetical protein
MRVMCRRGGGHQGVHDGGERGRSLLSGKQGVRKYEIPEYESNETLETAREKACR